MFIYCMSGKKRSGKNQTAEFIKQFYRDLGFNFENGSNDYHIIEVSTAQPMKQLCEDAFSGQATRDFFHEHGLHYKDENWWEEKTPFTRKMLQLVGTELFQAMNGSDFWALQLAKQIQERIDRDCLSHQIPVVIVTDTRWVHEINTLKARLPGFEVKVVRISRPETDSMADTHISETALDDYDWDIHIVNDGTLDELNYKTYDMLKSYEGINT